MCLRCQAFNQRVPFCVGVNWNQVGIVLACPATPCRASSARVGTTATACVLMHNAPINVQICSSVVIIASSSDEHCSHRSHHTGLLSSTELGGSWEPARCRYKAHRFVGRQLLRYALAVCMRVLRSLTCFPPAPLSPCYLSAPAMFLAATPDL